MISILALLGLLMSCTPHTNLKEIALRGPQGELIGLRVEIADEADELEQGLMYRTELAPSHGMLFLFSEQRVLAFWMKNTLIPLDVLFFDRNNRFVSSRTMEPCTEDPCRSYSSGAPAVTALEVPAGFVEENRIGIGWTLVR